MAKRPAVAQETEEVSEQQRVGGERSHQAPPQPGPARRHEQQAGEAVGQRRETRQAAGVGGEVARRQTLAEGERRLEAERQPLAGERVDVAGGVANQGDPAAARDRTARRLTQGPRTVVATGTTMWFDAEPDLDAVTALSGSGPAYVFYFVEAMIEAAVQMGLSADDGRRLALDTFDGATALAAQSTDPPALLRERVTSKGGTTHAAITALEASGVRQAFVAAMLAAQRRARELDDEFGR